MDINQFKSDVKRYFELIDLNRKFNSRIKEQREPIKNELSMTQEKIKSYMVQSHVDVCNYQEERLELKRVKKSPNLSKKVIEEALIKYFDNDENKGKEVFEYLVNYVGSSEVLVLKRLKNKKTKTTEKKTNTKAPKGTQNPIVFTKKNNKGSNDKPPDLSDESDND